MYVIVNRVYRKVRGVDLPFNEFYSPIRAIGFRTTEQTMIEPDGSGAGQLDQLSPRSTLGPWSITRVKHLNSLAQLSNRATYNRHVNDLAHFIAWEEKVRLWNRLLSNAKFRAFVVGVYGQKMYEAMTTTIERITAGSHERALMRGMDKFITNLTISRIVGKPIAFVKQMSSLPAFLLPVPVEDTHLFFKAAGQTVTEGLSEEWVNSAFVRSRGLNQSQELRALQEWIKSGHLLKHPDVMKILAGAVSKGDITTILLGGDALFKYLRSTGKSVDEAIAIASKTARETQSTGDIPSLSVLQGQTGAWRLLTAYKNQPIQFMRIEMQALRSLLITGRMSKKEAVKSLIIFHFIIPMIFQSIIDLGWDEEHQKRAMFLGSFNDIPILGQLLSNLMDAMLFVSGTPMGSKDLMESWKDEIVRGVKELTDEPKLDDFIKAFTLLSDAAMSAAYGIPTKPFIQAAIGAKKIAMDKSAGSWWEGTRLMLGFSPYMIREQDRRKKVGEKYDW
jgi:hypothetical protein